MNLFTEFLKRNKQKRITVGVVGDAMIDEYYCVNVNKISPEFPIPVMHSTTSNPAYSLPGGAANVAYQFKHFNVDAYLISFTDSEADRIFRNHGINTRFCGNLGKPLPRKKRFYSDDFPTCRWDVEIPYTSHELWPEIRRDLAASDIFFDVLLFSDYDKGFFNEEVCSYFRDFCKARYKIVDPKKNLVCWRGYDLIKPNYSEACALTGERHLEKQYDLIKRITEAKEVMITLGGKGVYSKNFEYNSKEVNNSPNSVIGAGDCFMTFVAMTMAHDFMPHEVAEIAFEMGSLYVQEKYNSPITISKILHKYVPEEAKYVFPNLPRDYSLCFTNGCFDILHRGHIETLKFAKSKAEKLIVAVNTDESVARLKPGRPINSLTNRMAVLANLECVDYIVPFGEDTPYELIKKLKPDVLVKGEPYCAHNVVGADLVEKVYIAPKFEDLSSTGIIKKL